MIDRARLYEKLTKAARRLADETDIVLSSYVPEGDEEQAEAQLRSLPPAADGMAEMIRSLDAMSPLERDLDASVREHLFLDYHGHSGHAWICLANAVGKKEHVTTFPTAKGCGQYFDQWCRAREDSVLADTPWDDARRGERRVVDYGDVPTLIDRGAVHIVDLVNFAGCRTIYSCEGHPQGAYLGFEGDDHAIRAAFEEAGWQAEGHGGRVTVRMPTVAGVAARDANWRGTCAILEERLGWTPHAVEERLAVEEERLMATRP